MMALTLLACVPRIDPGPVPAEAAVRPVAVHTLTATEGPNVYLAAVIGAGSAYDPIGQEGLAHLVGRALLDAGAGDLTSAQVRDALFPLGASFDVVVDRDWVSVRLTCHRDHARICVDRFADALIAPRFDAADWIRLRDDALHTVDQGLLDDPEALGLEVLEDHLFNGHPYGHPVEGRSGVLPTLSPELGRAFHARHYVRPNVTVGLAGAWTPEVHDALSNRLLDVPPGPSPELAMFSPVPTRGHSALLVRDGSSSTGWFLGHALDVDRSHPDFVALHVATLALGAHRESFGRLFRRIRTEQGLNYGDYAYIEPWRERPGSRQAEQGILRRHNRFVVWLRPTSLDDALTALGLAFSEVEAWVTDGLTESELERVKTWASATLPLHAPDPGRRLLYELEAVAAGTPNLLDQAPAIDALTVDDVNAAIRRHIHPEDLQVVAVTGDPEALKHALVTSPEAPGTIQAPQLDPERVTVIDGAGIFR